MLPVAAAAGRQPTQTMLNQEYRMTQLEAPRRSPVLAVVVAVGFLAVLGSAVGMILGTTKPTGHGVAAGPSASPGTTASPSPPAMTDTGNVEPTGPATTSSSTKPAKTYAPPTRDTCPDYTVEAANQH